MFFINMAVDTETRLMGQTTDELSKGGKTKSTWRVKVKKNISYKEKENNLFTLD